MEIQKLTSNELKIIREEYKKSVNFYLAIMGGLALISIILLFIPASLLGRRARRAGVTDTIIESFGVTDSIIYMVIALLIFGLIFYFVFNIRGLKEDISKQEKITVKAKVIRIENVPADIVKDMEGGKDTILHFDITETKIKNLYFNKRLNPELLTAKYVYVERTRYGKKDLRFEVISE